MKKENKEVTAYPLCWPLGRARTATPEPSRFKVSREKAFNSLVREINLLGGKNIIISTNVKLRQDGLQYAKTGDPFDSGVAVYFDYKNKPMCFACDRWRTVSENMQAVSKTIEALRGINRWGSGDMMESAFSGFAALTHNTSNPHWRNVLNVSENATFEEIEKSYKALRSTHHPDKGGSSEMFNAIQNAWEQAKAHNF